MKDLIICSGETAMDSDTNPGPYDAWTATATYIQLYFTIRIYYDTMLYGARKTSFVILLSPYLFCFSLFVIYSLLLC